MFPIEETGIGGPREACQAAVLKQTYVSRDFGFGSL